MLVCLFCWTAAQDSANGRRAGTVKLEGKQYMRAGLGGVALIPGMEE